MTTQTSQSQTRTTRRFFHPSDFDREWAAHEFDIAADARIARCRAAKVQRGRGPSRQDERDAAAMFAEMEEARQEQITEDRRIFDRQNTNPYRSGGSRSREIIATGSDNTKKSAVQLIVLDADDFAGKPGICQICEECDFLDEHDQCPECRKTCTRCGVHGEIDPHFGLCDPCLDAATEATIACQNGTAGLGYRVF